MLSTSPDLTSHEAADLEAARDHDGVAFARLVAPHRAGLHAHCYRMLGSAHDAEDAQQEALLRAWRALPRFEGRSSLRTWLFAIATNVCLKALARRAKRVLPADRQPPADVPQAALEGRLHEVPWLEPLPEDGIPDGRASPVARYEQRESVELAFTAALQHLPARQRAVLLLRDVLGFAPAEIAEALDATPAAIYSALQRARATAEEKLPDRSQQATLRALGDRRLRDTVERYARAWEAGDVPALTAMLTADATFAMPPQPAWFQGREAIGAFLAAHPLSTARWRVLPARANGQLAFGFYEGPGADGRYAAHALTVVTLAPGGLIADATTFFDPWLLERAGLPAATD